MTAAAVLLADLAVGGFVHTTTGDAEEDLFLDALVSAAPVRLPLRAFVAPGSARPLATAAVPPGRSTVELPAAPAEGDLTVSALSPRPTGGWPAAGSTSPPSAA